jgi:hypothetical protein
MSVSRVCRRETPQERSDRFRRARVAARERRRVLEAEEQAARLAYEHAAAAVLLGDAEEAAVEEEEAELDRVRRELRRARAAADYLA